MLTIELIQGDCLEKMKDIPDGSVDAVITDPPYGLSFMGKHWDKGVPSVEFWVEMLRLLKPGGYLLSFSGTRTYHRMASAIEDAGFEIRDMIEWVYGSGFPKSLNIGKAVDKLQGNEREEMVNERWAERYPNGSGGNLNPEKYGQCKRIVGNPLLTSKGTSEWEGWGTALKPAHEPICMARKPLSEKTVAENVLKWGTGGINVDGSRVGTEERTYKGMSANQPEVGTFRDDNWVPKDIEVTVSGRFPANLIHDNSEEVRECFPESKSSDAIRHNKKDNFKFFSEGEKQDAVTSYGFNDSGNASRFFKSIPQGRFPANLIHDNSEEVRECFPDVGKSAVRKGGKGGSGLYKGKFGDGAVGGFTDSGNASRFFKSIIYQAKASKAGRGEGNNHPTVKPVKLMEYLVNMVTRKGGTVLDPFMGSGTTGVACKNLNRNFIGIELDPEYLKIAEKRISDNQSLFTV